MVLLIAGCGSVCVLSMLIGVLILMPSLLTTPLTAVVALLYGPSIVYLALALRIVYAPGLRERTIKQDDA